MAHKHYDLNFTSSEALLAHFGILVPLPLDSLIVHAGPLWDTFT